MGSGGIDLAHFQARVIQDAVAEASALQWERRAGMLEWARPRVDDFPGEASVKDRQARWSILTQQARACRNHAALLRMGGGLG
jgi:hypothetical protein